MKAILAAVMPNAGNRIDIFDPYIEATCTRFGITSDLNLAMFVAQIAHESSELRYVRELASGAAYEGRRDLGNTEPGDGVRFRGRGLIQLTGRDNYQRCGAALGLDLIAHPELLEEPKWAAMSAGWFWQANGLTALAEGPDALERCTRRINGGLNGLDSRRRYYERALIALGAVQAGASTAQTSSGVSTPSLDQPSAPAPDSGPPAPIVESTPAWEAPMGPFVAAALPALIQSIPELIRSFGSDGKVTERNAKAAEAVLQVVQTATGTQNAQAAVEAVQNDPTARLAATQALEAEHWFELTEAGGGGVEGARQYSTQLAESGDRVWNIPAFWITLGLLPLLYGTVWLVLTGPDEAFSGELRAAIASSVVTGVLGGVIGYWLGLKFSSPRGAVMGAGR